MRFTMLSWTLWCISIINIIISIISFIPVTLFRIVMEFRYSHSLINSILHLINAIVFQTTHIPLLHQMYFTNSHRCVDILQSLHVASRSKLAAVWLQWMMYLFRVSFWSPIDQLLPWYEVMCDIVWFTTPDGRFTNAN